MSEMKFTKDHEWITVEGDTGIIGITDHAKEALGDLVYLDLPETGKQVARGDDFAVVESVKAASEIYSPVDGEITEVNDNLPDNLDDLGGDQGKGWIVKIKLSDAAQIDDLMDEAAYKNYINE